MKVEGWIHNTYISKQNQSGLGDQLDVGCKGKCVKYDFRFLA